MQQSYPALDDALLDVDAESWMARLKAQVDAVRRLRSEMSLSPAQRVPLILALDKEDERHSAGLDVPFLKVLGKLSDVSIVEDLPRDGIAPVEIVGSARLMLSIQIDRAAEVARLSREIERIEVDIEKLAPRLENPGFLSRAPAEVIAQEKAKLKQNHATLAKLRDQRARLGAPHQAMD
jgi:valyl-tRNA synthetase